jgi:hypothetical protein
MFDYSMFGEEFDVGEEEDIVMILALHKSIWPKHGGSVFGRERLRWAMIDGHNQLMHNYFADSVKHIAESVKFHDTFFEKRRNTCIHLSEYSNFVLHGAFV